MRLTCPKCNARYEVGQAALPTEGRDVQCSGCGNTWFQAHPDHPSQPDRAAAAGDMPGRDHQPPDTNEAFVAERAHRELDPAVIEILRHEAERESRLRALERGAGLESQPDLGLDFAGPGAPGQTPRRGGGSRPASLPSHAEGSGALPDVGNLNATLRPQADPDFEAEPVPAATRAGSTSGFVSGFGLVAVTALALVLVYSNASRIGNSLPQVAPVMDIYVAKVDRGRVWLDSTIGSYVPKQVP